MEAPLIAEPVFSPRLWGSRDLRPFFAEPPDEPIGEAWLTADSCRVLGKTLTLKQLAAEAATELFGPGRPAQHTFPLLIKILFPNDFLSVQVHPDDAYARAHGWSGGKTEMWHILRAEPGARIGLNLLPGKTLEELLAACRAGESRDLLEWHEPRERDTFFVPAGTIHALGPGLVLCEVQQASDVTFRLDDFGRRDAQGRLRELHLEHGLAVARPRTQAGRVGRHGGEKGMLLECEYFRVAVRELTGTAVSIPAGFRVLVPLTEGLRLSRPQSTPLPLRLAHAAILPASAGPWRLEGTGRALDVTLP